MNNPVHRVRIVRPSPRLSTWCVTKNPTATRKILSYSPRASSHLINTSREKIRTSLKKDDYIRWMHAVHVPWNLNFARPPSINFSGFYAWHLWNIHAPVSTCAYRGVSFLLSLMVVGLLTQSGESGEFLDGTKPRFYRQHLLKSHDFKRLSIGPRY